MEPNSFVPGFWNLLSCPNPACDVPIPHGVLSDPLGHPVYGIVCVTDLIAAWKKQEIPYRNRLLLDNQARTIGIRPLRKDVQEEIARVVESLNQEIEEDLLILAFLASLLEERSLEDILDDVLEDALNTDDELEYELFFDDGLVLEDGSPYDFLRR